MGVTNIEWTATVNPDGSITPGRTWNPTTGCTRVSEGCRNCYAFQLHDMRHKAHSEGKAVPAQYAKPFKELQMFDDRLTAPLSWRKPARIFVNSMSDLFHKDVPDAFIDRVFATMALADWHTYQVLTKRPERMAAYLARHDIGLRWSRIIPSIASNSRWEVSVEQAVDWTNNGLPNVWLGTSVENQSAADERIPHLLKTPAEVRFLSCEPLLGPVDLEPWLNMLAGSGEREWLPSDVIHWVIVGGESGAGARPCNVAWVRSIVEQCKTAGVPCFVKQLGSNYADENNGICGHGTKWPFDVLPSGPYYRLRDKKGGDMAEWPESLRVREFPKAVNA